MPLSIVIAAAIAASAPATYQPYRPTAADLAEALSETPPGVRAKPGELRAIVCQSVEEEPTEFPCTYQRRTDQNRWAEWSVVIAIDGGRWIAIDEPAQVLARRR